MAALVCLLKQRSAQNRSQCQQRYPHKEMKNTNLKARIESAQLIYLKHIVLSRHYLGIF